MPMHRINNPWNVEEDTTEESSFKENSSDTLGAFEKARNITNMTPPANSGIV
jgi:hypothetical protein